MKRVQVGSVTVQYEGGDLRRWQKQGKDRLYLDKGGFIDLQDEEGLAPFEQNDPYHWTTSRQVEVRNSTPTIVGRTLHYRSSQVIVSWEG
jgi:hypothetical protein